MIFSLKPAAALTALLNIFGLATAKLTYINYQPSDVEDLYTCPVEPVTVGI